MHMHKKQKTLLLLYDRRRPYKRLLAQALRLSTSSQMRVHVLAFSYYHHYAHNQGSKRSFTLVSIIRAKWECGKPAHNYTHRHAKSHHRTIPLLWYTILNFLPIQVFYFRSQDPTSEGFQGAGGGWLVSPVPDKGLSSVFFEKHRSRSNGFVSLGRSSLCQRFQLKPQLFQIFCAVFR